MYCPNCDEEHDGKFCPECGTKLEKRAVLYCPNCNEEHDGKFCPECGTKLEKRAVGSDDAQGIPEELEEEPRESVPRSIESWLGLSTGDDDKDVEEQPSADDYLDFDFDTDNDIEEQPKADNPTGPSTGSYRVYRGGSWNFGDRYSRVSTRNFNQPSFTRAYLGLRLAR